MVTMTTPATPSPFQSSRLFFPAKQEVELEAFNVAEHGADEVLVETHLRSYLSAAGGVNGEDVRPSDTLSAPRTKQSDSPCSRISSTRGKKKSKLFSTEQTETTCSRRSKPESIQRRSEGYHFTNLEGTLHSLRASHSCIR